MRFNYTQKLVYLWTTDAWPMDGQKAIKSFAGCLTTCVVCNYLGRCGGTTDDDDDAAAMDDE